jgi:hypothetical protein
LYIVLKDINEKDREYILASKNKRARKIRGNKLLGVNSTAYSIMSYIEDNIPNNSEPKCSWCGSITIFSNYDYSIIGDDLWVIDIEYKFDKQICGRKDNQKTKNCEYKKLNPNSKEFVMRSEGLNSLEEANEVILKRNSSPFYRTNYNSDEEYSKAQRRDIEFFGSKERYEEFKNNLSKGHKEEYYIEKYGKEKGIQKFKEICTKKDSMSIKFHKRKYGDDWENRYENRLKDTLQTTEALIYRHGYEQGKAMRSDMIKKATKTLKITHSKLSKEELKLKYDSTSKEYHKRKYGDDWEIQYKNRIKSLQAKAGKASKESLVFFKPLMDRLSNIGIKYHIGITGNKEYFIWDKEYNKLFLYDFCIPSLKIIVEFNGSLWHYNKNHSKYFEGNHPYGLLKEDVINKDKHKKQLALNNGFDYFVVWDTDDYDVLLDEIHEAILKKYEITEKE